jgi:DNA-binding MarR family transcriptional regulator
MAKEETDDLAAIVRGLERWLARLGRQFGPLSRPQRRMLAAVAAGGDAVRVGDLAAGLGLSMPGTTRMLDALEAQSYVRRVRPPAGDQRQVYIALAPEGAGALHEANRVFQDRVRDTLAGLDAADRRALAHLLTRIEAASEPPIEPTPAMAGAAGERCGR